MRLLNIKEMIPDIYCQESRDFQILCNIYSAVTNSIKHDSDTAFRLLDTKTIRAEMLELLSTKLGFFTNKNFSDADLREALSGFRDIVNNKGTLWSVSSAVNIFLKALGIHNKVRISVTTEKIVFGGKTIKDHTVIVSIESPLQDTTLLEEIFKYIIPAGYEYIITFYLEIDPYDDLQFHENVTMLYISDVKNSNIRGEVTWTNLLKFAYSGGWSYIGTDHSFVVNDDYSVTVATTGYSRSLDTFYLINIDNYIHLLPAGTYTLSGGKLFTDDTYAGINIMCYSTSGSLIISKESISNPVTFTVDQAFYPNISYVVNTNEITPYEVYPMLNEGTEATSYEQPSSPGNITNNKIYVSYLNDGISYTTGSVQANYTTGALNVYQVYKTYGATTIDVIPYYTYPPGEYVISGVDCSIIYNVADDNKDEEEQVDDTNETPTYTYVIKYDDGTTESIKAWYGTTSQILLLKEKAQIKVTVTLPIKSSSTYYGKTLYLSTSSDRYVMFVPPGCTYTADIYGNAVTKNRLTSVESKIIGAVDTVELIGDESKTRTWNSKNLIYGKLNSIFNFTIVDGDAFANSRIDPDSKTYFDMKVELRNGSTITFSDTKEFRTTGRVSYTFTSTGYGTYLWIYHQTSSGSKMGMSFSVYTIEPDVTYTLSFDLERCDPSVLGGLLIRNIMLEKGSTMTDYEPRLKSAAYSSPNYRGLVRALREVIDPVNGDWVGVLSGKEYYVHLNNANNKLKFAGEYSTLQSIPSPVENTVVHIVSNQTYYRRGEDSWIELNLRAHLNDIYSCQLTDLQDNDLIITDRVIYYERDGCWYAINNYPSVYRKFEEVT